MTCVGFKNPCTNPSRSLPNDNASLPCGFPKGNNLPFRGVQTSPTQKVFGLHEGFSRTPFRSFRFLLIQIFIKIY